MSARVSNEVRRASPRFMTWCQVSGPSKRAWRGMSPSKTRGETPGCGARSEIKPSAASAVPMCEDSALARYSGFDALVLPDIDGDGTVDLLVTDQHSGYVIRGPGTSR